MVTIFSDVFVTRKGFFGEIFVRINVITNNKIVELLNFGLKYFRSSISSVNSAYQEEYAECLTTLVSDMTS